MIFSELCVLFINFVVYFNAFMEWLSILSKGILIGFVASIPLGPIGVICVQRTLCNSHKSGFVSGLGAAAADTIFAVIAAFFLGLVLSFVEKYINILKVIGGICVIIVGVNIFLKNPVMQIKRSRANKTNLWSNFLSVFFITFTNPAIILMFMALFATLGISAEGAMNHIEGAILVGGVFIGAAIWWFILTLGVSFLRKKFRPRHLLVMNRVSGAIIVALGAAAILSLFVNMPVQNIIY